MPKVSVIIPTYNSASYIIEAVESVLNQTYKDFEVIVVDDGSTDNTHTLLEPYLDRIMYRFQENRGESIARNEGIRIAQGEYITFLDSDDWWMPSKLERQVPLMEAIPEAVLAYAYSITVDDKSQPIKFRGRPYVGRGEAGLSSIFDRLVISNCITNANTVIVRNEILEKTTLFDPAIQWGEDWDLWLRLAMKGLFYFIPEPLACYRIRKRGRRLQIEASDEFVIQNEKILEKVFCTISPDDQYLKSLRSKAFEALYLRSAMYNYELLNTEKGCAYIQKAFSANPGLYQNMYPLSILISDNAVRILSENKMDKRIGVAFINNIFDHLPIPRDKRRFYRSRALSEFHMAEAFTQFGLRNRLATLSHIAHALMTSPSNIQNRGLISIGLQSIFGRKIWK